MEASKDLVFTGDYAGGIARCLFARCREKEKTMNSKDIKAYCERQLEKMEQVVAFNRSEAWYNDQIRLRTLWLQAEQNERLLDISERLITLNDTIARR